MAAGQYTMYNSAKGKLWKAIDLSTAVIYSALYKSTSNASTYTLTNVSQLTNPVSGGGYTGAKTLTGVVVSALVSAKQYNFDSDNPLYTASGAAIGSIMYEVVYASGGHLLGWCKLSAAAFNITSGNSFTIERPIGGMFNITSTP